MSDRHIYKVHDKIYNLHDFLKIHPGGDEVFNNIPSYTDITPMIYAYHSDVAIVHQTLKKFETTQYSEIKFNYDSEYLYDSYCELKQIVYGKIKAENIELYWSNYEKLYNMIMLSLYVWLWSYCMYNSDSITNTYIIMLAVYTVGWGIRVFHETSHYCGFKTQKYNILFADYFPFANTPFWKNSHNFLHHSFTDTKYDCDLLLDKSSVIRYTNTPINKIHKFQYIYIFAILLFGGIKSRKHNYFSLLNSKKIVILIMLYSIGIYKLILFYSVLGFLVSFLSNLNHIQHDCIQINVDRKNDFLYNQVSSTMNYKTNILIEFICFGLDVQIEHHLFPNIPHSSLLKIKPIVKNYCYHNNIPYIEKHSIFEIIYLYIKYLYDMGNN